MNFFENNVYPTPLRNTPVLPILLLSLAQQTNAPKTTNTFKDEYDFIVVGGGSAGAVVASRLSEYTCVRVLLLEAGKSPPLLNDVPVLARNFWFTDIDWQYKTVPQKYCGDGLVNKQVLWPSGKGLGGSSLLNGMMYVRGNHKNYDDWAKVGAKGWNYSEVLPYFKKLEDNKDYNNEYHGVGGPVTVHKPRYAAEVKESLLETSKLFGYEVLDSNGATQTGYYDHQANHRNGQRCSTAKAYLVPAEDRENLDIVTHAFVKKVVIENHQAVGVEFDHGGSSHTVRAKREVIMSAGAVNSAQLLMLSGIGPKEHLQKLNIKVVEDLPVGDNFQDHNATPIPIAVDSSVKTILQRVLSPRGFFITFTTDQVL
ncbi:hypothetical protein JTE90_012066 [Oedothorax gibbosus]|uniref:Glucose-methanol-choline oxidoreductase N-terminal domain-containing protein n=1 Tax=Oedothorax gibbosus TaxID=931172 RepID=A0AAV6TS56_9ARAC|nr:hypothetical protein JTE90_012066 [Oedothorax gibbosus]